MIPWWFNDLAGDARLVTQVALSILVFLNLLLFTVCVMTFQDKKESRRTRIEAARFGIALSTLPIVVWLIGPIPIVTILGVVILGLGLYVIVQMGRAAFGRLD